MVQPNMKILSLFNYVIIHTHVHTKMWTFSLSVWNDFNGIYRIFIIGWMIPFKYSCYFNYFNEKLYAHIIWFLQNNQCVSFYCLISLEFCTGWCANCTLTVSQRSESGIQRDSGGQMILLFIIKLPNEYRLTTSICSSSCKIDDKKWQSESSIDWLKEHNLSSVKFRTRLGHNL